MTLPFKSKLDPFRTITERNKVFHTLNAAEQRQEIAYDLLTLILLGHVTSGQWTYWEGNYLDERSYCNTAEDLHVYFNQIELRNAKCEVCARGGMMLSQIRLGNTLTVDTCGIGNGDAKTIVGFTYQEYHDMESLYEGYTQRNTFNGTEYNTWIADHPYSERTTERLANICLNVIVNGVFDEEDFTDYVTQYNVTIRTLES